MGNNGWYISPVTINLSANDLNPTITLSGVKANSTVYTTTSGSFYTPYTGDITISSDGIQTYYYKSEDNAGNMESEKNTGAIKIDKTSPTGSITQASIDNSGATSVMTVKVTTSDVLSGIDISGFILNFLNGSTPVTPTLTSPFSVTGDIHNGVGLLYIISVH